MFIFMLFPLAYAYTPGSVQVTVRDYDSGAALSGVEVSMEPGGYVDITGPSGVVTFTNIMPYRNYTVAATLDGYAEDQYGSGRTGFVQVKTGETTLVNIPLKKASSISGQVTTGGVPLADIMVALLRWQVGPGLGFGGGWPYLQAIATTRTDLDGNYVFPSIADGVYSIRAAADSYYLATEEITLSRDEDAIQDFLLTPGTPALTVTVTFDGLYYGQLNSIQGGGLISERDPYIYMAMLDVPPGAEVNIDEQVAHYYTANAPGDYTAAMVYTDKTSGVCSEGIGTDTLLNHPTEAHPSVIPGPSELPLLYDGVTYATSRGTTVVTPGETVYLRGWGRDYNVPSPEEFNSAAPMFDIYGNKNGDWNQSDFSFAWSLRDGLGADQTALLSSTTTRNVSFTVPAGASAGDTYIASLEVTGDLGLADTPTDITIAVASTIGTAMCAMCHSDVNATYVNTRHNSFGIGCEYCHGPGSQHMSDTTKIGKTHWPGNCGQCHGQFAEWQKSRHSDPLAFGHAEPSDGQRRTCYKCHYTDGFIGAVESGEAFSTFKHPLEAGENAPRDTPNISCDVCHDPHDQSVSNPVGIRTGSPESLCDTCHEKKWQNATYTGTGDTLKAAIHWDDYSQYQGAGNPHQMPDACVSCHMATDITDTDAYGVRKVGGHSLRMRDVGADGDPGTADDLLNITVCQGCHPGLTTFDRNSTMTRIKNKLNLLDIRLKSANKGYLPPFLPGKCATCHKGGTLAFSNETAERTLEKAYLNYKLILHDRSFGIHNPGYIERLLDDTIAAVEPYTLITLSSFTATPYNQAIRITWSTEAEMDNAGFNIYRAETEGGEYLKINADLIPSEGSPAQGASYELIDEDVENRQKYYYKLEDIDFDGVATMHGPVQATPRLVYGST